VGDLASGLVVRTFGPATVDTDGTSVDTVSDSLTLSERCNGTAI
jgi:hypothetical protein